MCGLTLPLTDIEEHLKECEKIYDKPCNFYVTVISLLEFTKLSVPIFSL